MESFKKDFAAFILSHGRADSVITYKTLKKQGYTGDIIIILSDDETDEQIKKYKENFGENNIYIFSKSEAEKYTDVGDISKDKRVVIYARNMCHKIAQELGYKYFVELDDDYTSFDFRYAEENKLKAKSINNLDRIFKIMVKFLNDTNAITVAFAQAGDFIGGAKGTYRKKVLRKVMNSFFCRTDKPFKFYGRINEDTTMYCLLGQRGELMFTITDIALVQKQTQANSGGMTEVYLDKGTYLKSFYSVMYCPSCVKVSTMGRTHRRIHHKISWNNCTPKIINQKYKKD